MNTLTNLQKPWTWLLVAFLSIFCMPVQASDWMKNSGKFYMSNSKDHVTFNVFLCNRLLMAV